MNARIMVLVLGLLSLLTGGASAEATQKRSITQAGGGAVWSGSAATPGVGLSGAVLTFFDPASDEGLYYSLASGGTVSVAANGWSLSDTRVFQVGWRPSLWGSPWRVDLNASPVVGARYDGQQLVGSVYTGLGASVGLYVPVLPAFDLGVSLDSVVNVAQWGAPRAESLSYTTLVVSLAFKTLTESRRLPW
jgi:hypothetical protein